MSSKLNPPKERTFTRHDPALPGHRSYTLSSAVYNRLIAKGVDPETVAEAELARRAKCFCDYDYLGRITRVLANCRPPKSVTYPKTDR